MRAQRLTALLAILVLSACGGAGSSNEQATAEPAATAQPAPSLDLVTSMGVMNAREPMPGLISAGQPTQEQFDALVKAGYTRIISLRPQVENGTGWEEAEAQKTGAFFARIPIDGAADLTRENVELLDRILENGNGEPTVLYCASSNRVGALLALRAAWLKGASPQDALDLGKAAGMTRMEPAVTQLLLGS